MSSKPWDIYAKELFSVGLGYPLWMPERGPSGGREVFIGEVGWLKECGFCAFFNAMKGADHPINQGKNVPRSFQIFCPPNLSMGKSDKVTQKMVFSQSISGDEADFVAIDIGAISTGVGRRFRTRSDAGAFVMLDPPGVAEQIESKRHIVNYIRDHFDSWLEFANASHLDLHADDIMFICGTLKTARWAVAAFQGDVFRDKDGYVFGQLDQSHGHSDISIHISGQSLPDDHYRTGPGPLPGCGRDIPTPGVNQCLFVHYYKVKRRLQALPGPHQLSLALKTRGCDNASYDPVSYVLDYILQNSEAEIAIASDLDLISLFRDRAFPDNIADALMQLGPTIDLDENGVGTIDCDCISKDHMGTQPTSQDFSPAPRYATHPPEFPEHGGPAQGDPVYGNDEGGSVTALAYSADGKYVASGSLLGAAILIWDANANTVRYEVPLQGDAGHGGAITALAFSRNNNTRLASASRDGEIIIWGVEDGRERMRFDASHAIHSLAYTPDGIYLVGGAGDGTLHLWDAQTHEEVRTLTKGTAAISFIIFSDDGRLMATGGAGRTCYIWETESLLGGGPLSVLERHRGKVTAAAFSPDSRRIAVASDDGGIGIWHAGRGEMLVIIHEHTGPVWAVAFSPDGRRVASGAGDLTVKVCDSFTGERRLSLEGHGQHSTVNAVRFSPGGRYIASAASDNTVRLWNASDGTPRTTYREHEDNVATLMFPPDGSTLASGSRDGTVFIRPWMKEN